MKKTRMWKLGLVTVVVCAMLLSSVAGVFAAWQLDAEWADAPGGDVDVTWTWDGVGEAPDVDQTTFMMFSISLSAFAVGNDVDFDDSAANARVTYVNQQADLDGDWIIRTNVLAEYADTVNEGYAAEDTVFIVRAALAGAIGFDFVEWNAYVPIIIEVPEVPALVGDDFDDARTWGDDDWYDVPVAPVVPEEYEDYVLTAETFTIAGLYDAEDNLVVFTRDDWAAAVLDLVDVEDYAAIEAVVTWTVTWTADPASELVGEESNYVTFTVTIPALEAADAPDGTYADADLADAGTWLDGNAPEFFDVMATEDAVIEMYDDGVWVEVGVNDLLAIPDGDEEVLVRVTITVTDITGLRTRDTVSYFVFEPAALVDIYFDAYVTAIEFEAAWDADAFTALDELQAEYDYVEVVYTEIDYDGTPITHTLRYAVIWDSWEAGFDNGGVAVGVITAEAAEAARADIPLTHILPAAPTSAYATVTLESRPNENVYPSEPFDADLGEFGPVAHDATAADAEDTLPTYVEVIFVIDGQDVNVVFDIEWTLTAADGGFAAAGTLTLNEGDSDEIPYWADLQGVPTEVNAFVAQDRAPATFAPEDFDADFGTVTATFGDTAADALAALADEVVVTFTSNIADEVVVVTYSINWAWDNGPWGAATGTLTVASVTVDGESADLADFPWMTLEAPTTVSIVVNEASRPNENVYPSAPFVADLGNDFGPVAYDATAEDAEDELPTYVRVTFEIDGEDVDVVFDIEWTLTAVDGGFAAVGTLALNEGDSDEIPYWADLQITDEVTAFVAQDRAPVTFEVDDVEGGTDLGVVARLPVDATADDIADAIAELPDTVTITFTAFGEDPITVTFDVDWEDDDGVVGTWTGTIDADSATPALPYWVVLPILPELTATIGEENVGGDEPDIYAVRFVGGNNAFPNALGNGFRRVVILLDDEVGVATTYWTPSVAGTDYYFFWAPEIGGFDGVVRTTETDAADIEITWTEGSVANTNVIARYGDMTGNGQIAGVDSVQILAMRRRMLASTPDNPSNEDVRLLLVAAIQANASDVAGASSVQILALRRAELASDTFILPHVTNNAARTSN